MSETKSAAPGPAASEECGKWEQHIYVIITAVLGIIAILTIAGALWLTARGIPQIPDSIVALGSTAVGALAGVLVPRPSSAARSTKQG